MMHSLRTRLLLGGTAAAGGTLLLACLALYFTVAASMRGEFDASLASSARALASVIEEAEGKVVVEDGMATLPEYSRADSPDYYSAWLDDGPLLGQSASLNGHSVYKPSLNLGATEFSAVVLPDAASGRRIAMRFIPAIDAGAVGGTLGHPFTATLVVERHTAPLESKLARLRWLLASVCGVATVAAAVAMGWVVRRGLMPLGSLALRIASVGRRHFAERIDLGQTPHELERVVRRLNELLDRVEEGIGRERAFTSDVAHELRTPLAGLQATLELSAARPRTASEYEHAIAGCLRAVQGMHGMVENLLTLARADASQLAVSKRPVNLADLLDECWADYQGRAEQRGLRIEWDVPSGLSVLGDSDQLRVVLNNLFDNALSYCDDAAWIRVSARMEGGQTILLLANSGCSLRPEDAGRIFDRFWRGDSARADTGAHSGLGLALCRRIIELMAGEISAAVDPEGVFQITLRLPAPARADRPSPIPAAAAGSLLICLWLTGCQGVSPVDMARETDSALEGTCVTVTEHAPEGIDLQEPVPGTLTLAESVRRCVAHDPRIQSAISAVRVAEADALQARLLPNPILSATVRLAEAGGDPIIDIGLAEDVVSILQRPRRTSAADHRLRAAIADAVTALLGVLGDVQEAYVSAQAVEEQLASLTERRRLAERLLELGRARLRAGEGTNLDVITLETQRLQIEVDLAEKAQERTEARLTLARLIGEPSSSADWALSRWQPNDPTSAPEADWVRAALRTRPELRAKRWQLAAFGDEVVLARLAALEGGDVGAQSEWDQQWSVGPAITTPLPIFDFGQAKRAKAIAEQTDALHQITLLQRQIVQEVRTQVAAYASSVATLNKARQQLLPLLEKRADIARSSYQAGETAIANLLLAEDDLLDARTKVIELQKKASLARIKLERAAGGPASRRGMFAPSTAPATAPATKEGERP